MEGPHNDVQSTPAQPSATTLSAVDGVEVPDPDEDDLDDLDDLLDEFSSSKITAVKDSSPRVQTPQQNIPPNHESTPGATDDFTRQLQAQMAALMGEGEETPEMRGEIQAILQELSTAVETGPASNPQSSGIDQGTPSAAADESFQDAILRTMQRMQNSGDKAHAEAAAGEDSEDILAQMLKEMQNGGDSSASTGEPEFSKMLMTMMEQLTNKDILYDPMKELNDKFPTWMSNHKSSTKADDLLRYEKQQRLIKEIVSKFEENTYSDNNAKDREYIVERMQEVGNHYPLYPDPQPNFGDQMQAAGSPPADLVGDMSGAQTALQDMDSNCPQQ
ncbi:MAG: hypothetical protein Q9168_001327 [Polycauliona sp. 1 TL-2023]